MTSLRAFAALWVALYHLQFFGITKPTALTRPGFAAVGFFFVLSGFVLGWSTDPRTSPVKFWKRRLARIYPATLLVTLIALFVPILAIPTRSPETVITSIFLVQAWIPNNDVVFSLTGVTWSLSCEAFFYLLLPLILPWAWRTTTARRVAAAVIWFLAASAVVLVVAHLYPTNLGWQDVVYANPMVRFGEFALGLAAALEMKRGWRPSTGFAVTLIVAGLGLTQIVPMTRPFPDVSLALPFLGVILLVAQRDLLHTQGVLARRWLIYAGEVSFCFYLVHEPILLNISHLYPRGGPVVVAGILVAAAVAAVLLHELVEKPVQRRWLAAGRKGPDARPDRQRPATTPALVRASEAGVQPGTAR